MYMKTLSFRWPLSSLSYSEQFVIVLLKHVNFNSQRRVTISCYGVKPHKSGFDGSSERMFHNVLVICVSWEHLRIEKIKEVFHITTFPSTRKSSF